jgi:hypothetical protein
MPVLTVCPYCRQMIRVPDQAYGLCATCPRCQNCYTIAPPEPPKPKIHPFRRRFKRTAVAASREKAVAQQLSYLVLPPAESATAEPSTAAADLFRAVPGVKSETDPVLATALIALTLAGLALAVSQLSLGSVGVLVLAGVGLLLAFVSWLLDDRRRRVAQLGAGLNTAILLVVLIAPEWIGLPGAALARTRDDPNVVKSVDHDGDASPTTDWIDASKAAWQLGDVRVSVSKASVGFLDLNGPKGQKKRTKEACLQIWVRVTNEGVARRFDFLGWTATSGPNAPRLTDSRGKVLLPKTFETGWEPPGRPQRAALLPGRSAQQLFVYATPASSIDYLRLELPGIALGGSTPARLQIPESMIADWYVP